MCLFVGFYAPVITFSMELYIRHRWSQFYNPYQNPDQQDELEITLRRCYNFRSLTSCLICCNSWDLFQSRRESEQVEGRRCNNVRTSGQLILARCPDVLMLMQSIDFSPLVRLIEAKNRKVQVKASYAIEALATDNVQNQLAFLEQDAPRFLNKLLKVSSHALSLSCLPFILVIRASPCPSLSPTPSLEPALFPLYR